MDNTAMLDEALKWPGSQEAIQAFGKEFAVSSDFGKAWDVLVKTAQKNGSAMPLLFALFYDASILVSQNPWVKEQWEGFFNPKK
jgi:hypothetical protein